MGNDANLPGSLKSNIKKNQIPKEFFKYLENYKQCMANLKSNAKK
jgi:hypothetical protein